MFCGSKCGSCVTYEDALNIGALLTMLRRSPTMCRIGGMGMAGDHWGSVGITGDHWGSLGIAGVRGDRWGSLGTPMSARLGGFRVSLVRNTLGAVRDRPRKWHTEKRSWRRCRCTATTGRRKSKCTHVPSEAEYLALSLRCVRHVLVRDARQLSARRLLHTVISYAVRMR